MLEPLECLQRGHSKTPVAMKRLAHDLVWSHYSWRMIYKLMSTNGFKVEALILQYLPSMLMLE